MKDTFSKIAELIPVAGLAAFGGFTRALFSKGKNGPCFLRLVITEMVIAVFLGLLIHWLTQKAGISENLRTAAIALAGYSARSVMAVMNMAFNIVARRNVV